MNKVKETGYRDQIKKRIIRLREWVRPDMSDPPLIRVLKLLYKSIVLLILIALSPLLIVILIFVFAAAF